MYHLFFRWHILSSRHQERQQEEWMSCICLLMFHTAITHLYCLHDLAFLPEINHCQEWRGLQNTQGQKSLLKPLSSQVGGLENIVGCRVRLRVICYVLFWNESYLSKKFCLTKQISGTEAVIMRHVISSQWYFHHFYKVTGKGSAKIVCMHVMA